MTMWESKQVPFKFQLSDWTLFSVACQMQVRAVKLTDNTPAAQRLTPPTDSLSSDSQGFFIHALRIATKQPMVSTCGDYLCYTQLQYPHCFIDLNLSFDDYQKKFSSKTRSTINRKVRRYAEHCGGSIPWREYKAPSHMHEFFQHARAVSVKTYQEKLLDSGIPDSEEFLLEMESLAQKNSVRAYILFDDQRPVAYLYCPAEHDVLAYAYLGYDPDYLKMSVGTVLQWLAVEQLYKESCFKFFDFTEGQSEHKRLFATHEIQCANVIFMKKSIQSQALIYSHVLMGHISRWIGDLSQKLGIKARIKHLIRSLP